MNTHGDRSTSRYLPGLAPAAATALLAILIAPLASAATSPGWFSIRDFGATGVRGDDARPAIQKSIDACAAAGGGTVLVPAGEYTAGQIYLKSHVRLFIESGATLYVSTDSSKFEKGIRAAFLFGEDLENVTIEGRGTIDGQGEYVWRLNDHEDDYIRSNMELARAQGKPMMRPFPKGFPEETIFPRMVLLLRCKDVRIAGLSMVASRSWTIHPYACERLVIDGVYIRSSLKEGVWADGIDPDGCKDVRISNCTIETGDDALVFYSMKAFGPALPCENITVTNCRISSASSAIKFCDGNSNAVRKVVIDNCVITDSNRGIAFMVFDGGTVSDVIISNTTVECIRHDWFWWGDGDPIHFNIKRRSEISPQISPEGEPPPGSIRNVILRDIIARGKGSCMIMGHPESPLENITFDNVRLFLAADPSSYGEKAVNALDVRWARNLKLKDIDVVWGEPRSDKWRSALRVEDVQGLVVQEFSGREGNATGESAAVVLHQVQDAVVRDSKATEGTAVFLRVTGERSRDIRLHGNDLGSASPCLGAGTAPAQGVVMGENVARGHPGSGKPAFHSPLTLEEEGRPVEKPRRRPRP